MDVRKVHGIQGELWTGVDQCAEYPKPTLFAAENKYVPNSQSSISYLSLYRYTGRQKYRFRDVINGVVLTLISFYTTDITICTIHYDQSWQRLENMECL